ncbi:MAG: hypothetical protein KIT60_18885 [Burkholderiaceae bacterium]|nr:hypothetical protein [Burkholderiaceae bacterium]
MHQVIYTLCALTAASCAYLLLRGYRTSFDRLLLWGGLCFVGLTANNVLLILDRVVFTGIDMSTWRLCVALLAVLLLLYGLIVEGTR